MKGSRTLKDERVLALLSAICSGDGEAPEDMTKEEIDRLYLEGLVDSQRVSHVGENGRVSERRDWRYLMLTPLGMHRLEESRRSSLLDGRRLGQNSM